MTLTAANPKATIPLPGQYGRIVTDTAGLAEISDLVGGTGAVRWKELFHGMHLPTWPGRGWKCVEYVELLPGSSCGTHLHDGAEEIYYLFGAATMTIDGATVEVSAGDLVTAPIGTVHGISVPGSAPRPVPFLVAEVFPRGGLPRPYAHIPVPANLRYVGAGCYRGYEGDDLRIAQVDLSRDFTGPWHAFTLIEFPPGDDDRIAYHVPAGISEILFVSAGQASITVGPVAVKGGFGRAIAPALGDDITIANASADTSLQVISVELRNQR
jgi:Cupin domain